MTISADRSRLASWICGGLLALASTALAQPAPPPAAAPPPVNPAKAQGLPAARDYRPPQDITFKTTDFLSDNVRLTAQWFYAAGSESRKLPTVVMAHGWGATAASLREDAVQLARYGYLVMLFDYRGWGESDGRLRPDADGPTQLRAYIDPLEQTEDWFNAVSYAATAPLVDPRRIGVLGPDLAGGHVIAVAAGDPRVKAVVSEVTWADTRPSKPYDADPEQTIALSYAQASDIASGQAPYPSGGRPLAAKLMRWAPVDQAGEVKAPALFVLAQDEELFSNIFNGQRACDRVQGPRKLVMLSKTTHFDIYGAAHEVALNAAIDWFDRYLKPPGASTRVPINRREPERGECNPPPEPPKGEEPKDGSGAGHKAQDASGRWN